MDIIHKRLLVPFHLQDIIRIFLNDLLCGFFLRPNRIDCDSAPFQAKDIQKSWYCLYLVCFFIYAQLAEYKG